MEYLRLLLAIVAWIFLTDADGSPAEYSSTSCSLLKQKNVGQYLQCIAAKRRTKRQLMYFYGGQYGHPCYGAIRMNQPRRSINNVISPETDDAICDVNLHSRWYRFEGPAGGVMPNHCVPENTCGTHGPVWLNGNYPEEYGRPTDVEVCANKHGSCCSRRWYIRVANCGDFYSFLLNPTPGCFYAYCFGKGSRCPDGYNSRTGYTPGCTDDFPDMPGNVSLQLGNDPSQVTFICDYDGELQEGTVLHVEWFVDARERSGRGDAGTFSIWRETLGRGKTRSILAEENLMNRLGASVYCEMDLRFSDNSGVPSPVKRSDLFFAGIEILNRIVNISESGDSAVLRLQSRIPVICPPFEDCKVTIDLAFDPDFTSKRCIDDGCVTVTDGRMQQVVFGECRVEFTPDNWQEEKQVTVRAVRDFYTDGNKAMTLDFLPVYSPSIRLWNRYRLPDVQVLSSDTPTRMCSSAGDPHFSTFDGLHYSVFLEGEFILYKNTKMPIQVNARLQKCGRRKLISCNCAVAVLAADDVIVIDKCNRRNRNLAFGPSFSHGWNTVHRHALQQGSRFTEGLQIYEYNNGQRYTVHLPTGAFIDFHIGRRWINIYLFASSDDWESTLGLCGTFDGDTSNDFKHPDGVKQNVATSKGTCGNSVEVCEFAKSWRVPMSSSFFGPDVNVPLTDYKFPSENQFCRCEGHNGRSEVVCNYHYDVQNCKGDQRRQRGEEKTHNFLMVNKQKADKTSPEPKRSRRSLSTNGYDDVSEIDDDVQDQWDYFNSEFEFDADFVGQEPDWPEDGGILRQRALHHCGRVLNNTRLGQTCRQYIQDRFDQIYETCMMDIKITRDLSWSMSSLDTMATDCEDEIHTRASLWETFDSDDDDDEEQENPAATMLRNLCLNDCSRRGYCRDGVCNCRRGYTGEDCSRRMYLRPRIVHLSGSGVCDVTKRPCRRIRISGRGFKDDNMQCIFRRGDDVIKTSAHMETFEEVSCEMPSHRVTVHGDPSLGKGIAYEIFYLRLQLGQVLSGEKSYVVYNSHCYDCIVEGMHQECRPKDEYCVINGHCYGPGQTNPNDCCDECNPTQNRRNFTRNGLVFLPYQHIHNVQPNQLFHLHIHLKRPSSCSTFSYDVIVDSHGDAVTASVGENGVDITLQTEEVGAHYVTINASLPCRGVYTDTYNIFVLEKETFESIPPPPTIATSIDRGTPHDRCADNRGPYFDRESMEVKIGQGEEVTLALPVKELDKGDKLTYRSINAFGDVYIDNVGILRYVADSRGPYEETITVVVKDSCHAQAFMQLKVRVE